MDSGNRSLWDKVEYCTFFLLESMRKTFSKICHFLKSEEGPTAVEYAIMLALIIVGAIGAVLSTGNVQRLLFESIGADMDNAMKSN